MRKQLLSLYIFSVLFTNILANLQNSDNLHLMKNDIPSFFNSEENYRNPQVKVQTISKVSDEIDPNADLIIFERKEWVQPNGPFKDRCSVYDLPKVNEGKTITFYNKLAQVNILEDDTQYNEFWHIVLTQEKDTVTLQWTRKNGWVIVSEVQMPLIHSLRQEPTKFVFVLCPTRRIPGSIGDFVATIDVDKSSPLYGTIVNISWGSVSIEDDPSVEYHHGGLLEIGHETFLGAGSLRWNSANSNGGSFFDFYQIVSEKSPNLTAVATVLPENTIHTVHMNPYSNNIIASALGTSGTGAPSFGPGHFIEVIPNFLFPNTPLIVNNFHTIGQNPKELGPSTLEGNKGFQDNWAYDFSINFCTQTMVSSSWGSPNAFENGFDINKPYGRAIRIYSLELPGTGPSLKLLKRFKTNPVPQMAMLDEKTGEGVIPLEVRRVHHPGEEKYFVGITLPGAIDYIYKKGNKWKKRTIVTPKQLVADCAALNKKAKSAIPGGSPILSAIPSLHVPLLTDLTISGDDRYLYVSCWLAGCVVRYDIQKLLKDPHAKVKSNGGVGNLGGIIEISDTMPFNTNTVKIQGVPFNGGPQMLRLTPDSQTLFVTNSLFSSWDDQFFPTGIGSIRDNGGKMIKINTGAVFGKIEKPMEIDKNFLINFKDIQWNDRNNVPAIFTSRAHECHIKNVTH